MTEDSRFFNDMFMPSKPAMFNACVGDNGLQDVEVYAEGYLKAPLLVLEQVLINPELVGDVDRLVFPVVFCVRHSVELCLKESILKLRKMRDDRELKEYPLSKSHDIGEIWSFYKRKSESVDRRYVKINRELESYVNDIASMDPTGQVFRYPYDISDEKHLKRTPVISLSRLDSKLRDLQCLLDGLMFNGRSMVDEYQQKTFTNNLSRYDLYLISLDLPDRELWGVSNEIKLCKERVCEEFSISGREFDRAVTIITSHYELSKNIGVVNPLAYAKEEDFSNFLILWERYHEEDGPPQAFQVGEGMSVEEMIRRNEVEKELVDKCIASISPEALADLFTLYEIGRDRGYPVYCEEYRFLLERRVKEMRLAMKEGSVGEVDHYLSKTNFKDSLVFSLRVFGQAGVLNELSRYYGGIDDVGVFDACNNYPVFQ